MQKVVTCFNCNIKKDLNSENFAISRQNKSGFRGICKECDKAYHKEYQAKNKEKLDIQKSEYRQSHKQEKSVVGKIYRDKNVEKIRSLSQQHYLSNREAILSKVKAYRENNLDKIKDYRDRNREKRSQQKREWDIRNGERIAEYSKQYNLKNADRIKGWSKSYRLLNQDAMKEKRKLYLEENPEKAKESQRRYCLNNPDKLHTKSARRRALFKNAFVENVSRIEVYRRDGGICGICGKVINLDIKAPHAESLSLDHIIPLTKGGKHTYLNAQVAHYGCNSRKGNRI